MKILMTGQVGLEKYYYLDKVAEIGKSRGTNFAIQTVGQEMIDSYNGKVDDKTILNLRKSLLELLRRYAWQSILKESHKIKPHEYHIVNTHAVFRWHHGLFPAIDLDIIKDYDPDIVITLIDDIHQIKAKLQTRGTNFFELWELLAWREEEIWFSRFLTDSLNKLGTPKSKFYVIPKSQGPELLYRLLTEPDTQKIYLSFPVTALPDQKKQEIDEFKTIISEKFIAFDPLSISERSINSKAESLSSEIFEEYSSRNLNIGDAAKSIEAKAWSPTWDKSSALCLANVQIDSITIPGRQIVSVIEAIDSQIISRDYLLIDQCDIVLMYIRTDEHGTPQISAGCQSEMVYAYEQGKKVYVICPGGEKPLSPWVTQFSKVFDNLNDAISFLNKI